MGFDAFQLMKELDKKEDKMKKIIKAFKKWNYSNCEGFTDKEIEFMDAEGGTIRSRAMAAAFYAGWQARIETIAGEPHKENKVEKCSWVLGSFSACEELKTAHISIKCNTRIIEFKYCPFCGENIEKPITIEVGMFGKFSGDGHFTYGELTNIGGRNSARYKCYNGIGGAMETVHPRASRRF